MWWKISIVLNLGLVLAVLAIENWDPNDFLSEDDFEDHLDKWIEENQRKWTKDRTDQHNGCAFKVNEDLNEPQPVYLRNGSYVAPTGTTGIIYLNSGEDVYLACTGSKRTLFYQDVDLSIASANATCINSTLVYGHKWLDGIVNFSDITCSYNPKYEAVTSEDTCYNNNTVIGYGYTIDDIHYPLFHTCFDPNRLEALYAIYELNPENAVQQTGVSRPSWSTGNLYNGIAANDYYSKATQTLTLSKLIGEELANTYITNTQYLARGHLLAKADLILAFAQRSTFFFSNAAPQWQSINAGNWNWLEQNVRDRIGEKNYHTRVYTGTFGVSQLRDKEGRAQDLHLYYDENNNPAIPVPLYYYKAVYEPELRLGIVFITINNPYINETEAKSLEFCRDVCRNDSNYDWLSWKPEIIQYGWSFCCEIDDFRKTIPHLPEVQCDGILY